MSDEKKVKKVFRVFWAWQDQKEEEWLRNMSNQGWHLQKPGNFFFTFIKGKPEDVVYKMDFHILNKNERNEYAKIFDDAGWEDVGSVSNWHYFRIPAKEGGNPDIFSDTESRLDKYRRLIIFLLIFFPIIFNVVILKYLDRIGTDFFKTVLIIIYLSINALWIYAMLRLFFLIKKLRKKSKGINRN